MKSYSGDPYWTTARFHSVCQCGQLIKKGERMFYYPKGKVALCPKCSETAAADFQSCAQDEAFMNGGC